jgi:hypothetical protein
VRTATAACQQFG